MQRRNFLSALGAISAGVIVGEEVWEYLSHRKIFSLGAMHSAHHGDIFIDKVSSQIFVAVDQRIIEKNILHARRYGMSPIRFVEIFQRDRTGLYSRRVDRLSTTQN